MAYILVDSMNLLHRSRHVVRGDIDTRVGMCLHIMFSSVAKVNRDLGGTHAVFCFEGRSWRKDVYEPYKATRKVAHDQLSATAREEEEAFFEAFDDFKDFLHTQTNVTCLQAPGCEADDFIARWIQTHPDDEHIIVSSDSDFHQLISNNVSQYNGITNEHITINGFFNEKGKPIIDKKTGVQKTIGDPEWVLFEKCIRGDSSDNIFSAFPGVRKKGTKNKVGMLEAFADRDSKGFDWNNFMLQRWVDHEGNEHVVRDDYLRNVMLVDLTKQPKDIKDVMDEVIVEAVQAEHKGQVGLRFMKYCGKYNLVRLGENSTDHARYLGASYAEKAANKI